MQATASLQLDGGTLVFAVAMMAAFMAAMAYCLAGGVSRRTSAMKAWGDAMICSCAAYMLFYLRGHAPWFLTHFMANVFITASMPYAVIAYSRLFEVAVPVRFVTTAVTFGLAGMLAHYYLGAPSKLAIFT